MGIMDVLAELDDPETDTPIPGEPEAAEEPIPETRPVIIDVEPFRTPSRKNFPPLPAKPRVFARSGSWESLLPRQQSCWAWCC